MARDDMVRAVALAAQDRMTRSLSTLPRSSPERRRRDKEERRQTCDGDHRVRRRRSRSNRARTCRREGAWRRWLILTLIAVVLLASCANPHRFDPLRQQQLEHQQEECLAKGGNPRECRP